MGAAQAYLSENFYSSEELHGTSQPILAGAEEEDSKEGGSRVGGTSDGRGSKEGSRVDGEEDEDTSGAIANVETASSVGSSTAFQDSSDEEDEGNAQGNQRPGIGVRRCLSLQPGGRFNLHVETVERNQDHEDVNQVDWSGLFVCTRLFEKWKASEDRVKYFFKVIKCVGKGQHTNFNAKDLHPVRWSYYLLKANPEDEGDDPYAAAAAQKKPGAPSSSVQEGPPGAGKAGSREEGRRQEGICKAHGLHEDPSEVQSGFMHGLRGPSKAGRGEWMQVFYTAQVDDGVFYFEGIRNSPLGTEMTFDFSDVRAYMTYNNTVKTVLQDREGVKVELDQSRGVAAGVKFIDDNVHEGTVRGKGEIDRHMQESGLKARCQGVCGI